MKKIKKPISILLSVLMVLSVFAVVPFTASAAVGDFVPESEYLTFTAEEAGSSVTLNYTNGTLKYNKNNSDWVDYTKGAQIDLASAGDSVRFRGKDTTFDDSHYVSIGGKVACSGNVMSLRLDDTGKVQGLSNSCFEYMFNGCTGLTAAPKLPETTLASYCYSCMFNGCTSLTTAPELPATTLAVRCYNYMFSDCTSLTTAPELPATTLATYCYYGMFYGCTSLTAAPALPATELVTNCYASMFNGCMGIMLSETQTAEYSIPYSVPSGGNGTLKATNALNNMFANTGGTFKGKPTINTTYYRPAVKYTVTWKNDDGTILKTDTVEEGNAPTYDGTPVKAEDANNTYTFSGWTDGTNTYGKDDTLPAVSGDVTYTAQFDAVPKIPVAYYIVGTMNEWTPSDAYKLTKNPANDAEYMFTDLTVSAHTELKVKDSNGTWYPEAENFKLNDAGTYDIYFRPDGKGGDGWHYGNIFANNYRLPTYTVTWKNADGTTLKTDTVEKDAVPAYTGTTPEKAEDERNTYTFSGWTDGTNTYGKDDALPAVTGDVTYTATFTSQRKEITGSFGNLNWVIDTDGVLTFSGSGAIPQDAFKNNGDVKKVIINDSVTELGAYAFYQCPNLTEVDIQNPSVSFEGTTHHFAYTGVTTVTLPEGMTTIPQGMFRLCGALTTVDLPSTIKTIEDLAFMDSGLQSISVPEGATYDRTSFMTDSLQSLTLEGRSPMTFTGGEFTFLLDAATVYIPEGSTYVYSNRTLYVKDPSNVDAQVLLEIAQEEFNQCIENGYSPEEALGFVNDMYGDYYGVTTEGPFTVTLKEGDKCEGVFGGATIGKYVPAPTPEQPEVIKDCTYKQADSEVYANVPFMPVGSDYSSLLDGAINGLFTYGTIQLVDVKGYSYKFYDQTGTEIAATLSDSANVPGSRVGLSGDVTLYRKLFDLNLPENFEKLYIVATAPTTYTVTWKNGDTVLKTDTVVEGNAPAYTGTTPEKAEDTENTYTFSGWTDGTNTYSKDDTLPAVTGDVTYTATFDSTKRSYTITWKNDDGSVIDTNTVEYGETPTHAAPEKAEDEQNTYTFSGWTDGTNTYGKDDTLPAVTGDITYTATFTATEKHLNGPQDDGYFYLDDVKQIRYQLIQWHGDYYFINDGDKYAKNAKLYLSNTYVAGTGLAAGLYEFGADGKMQLKNGPQDDGYFYENGIRSNKLYRFVEFEGDWYFIYDGYKYAKNAHLYLSGAFLSGTDFAPGYFDFDADGKYYIPEELPEGANADGYFYINGVKQTRYQLIKNGNDYYFINDDDKYAKNTKLYLSDTFVSGTDLPAGLYEFGADGKMIISAMKNGPQDDGYFYINGARCQKLYRFVEFDGDWYFINDGYKYAKNARLYLGNAFLEGTDFAPGYFVFGADGKLVTA